MHTFIRIVLLALFASLPASAAAATVTVGLVDDLAVTPRGQTTDGIKLYTAAYARAVVLDGLVKDDANAVPPVGTIVHLATITGSGETPTSIGDVPTDAAGRFTLRTLPAHSFLYFARVEPTTGIAAATDATPIRLGVVPTIKLTTKAAQVGNPYRLYGFIDIPDPTTAGKMVLRRKTKGIWRVIGRQTTGSDGTFRFRVRHRKSGLYGYRITFEPVSADVWVKSTYEIFIRYKRR